MSKFFLLLVLVPVVELYLLIQLGGWMGFLPTILLIAVSGALGASLARREGRRVLHEWQHVLAQGRAPEEGLLSAALIVVGGILLVVPGVLTDVVGLLLLLPPSRRLVAARVRRHFERSSARGAFHLRHVHVTGGPGQAPPAHVRDVVPARAERWDRSRADRSNESDAELVDEPRDATF